MGKLLMKVTIKSLSRERGSFQIFAPFCRRPVSGECSENAMLDYFFNEVRHSSGFQPLNVTPCLLRFLTICAIVFYAPPVSNLIPLQQDEMLFYYSFLEKANTFLIYSKLPPAEEISV
jgi:hypothetical protein